MLDLVGRVTFLPRRKKVTGIDGVASHSVTEERWVFSKFVECMKGVKPGAILTDQCKSIEIGVKHELRGTLHRFCAWHITHKLSTKWGGT